MSLRNSRRVQVKSIVSLSPGIHLRKLQKMLGASFTTTRYHVQKLERDGEIVRSKDGRYDRLYPTGTADGMKAIYAALQSKSVRKILSTLAADSDVHEMTNGDLAARTRLPRSTISECVKQLSSIGLVRRSVTADGRILYEVRGRNEVLLLLNTFQRGALDMAAEGFINLWDL